MEVVLEKDGQRVGYGRFSLVRAPVQLCHGLNSNKEGWNTYVWSSEYLRTDLEMLDYNNVRVPPYPTSNTNVAGYGVNIEYIDETIGVMIAEYRSGDRGPLGLPAAIGRVDWVGHSMGGVLGRMYTILHDEAVNIPRDSSLAGNRFTHDTINYEKAPYFSASNSWCGAFRRIVTIGAPLHGSAGAIDIEKILKSRPAELLRDIVKDISHYRWKQSGGFGLIFESPDDYYAFFPNAILDLQPNSSMQQLIDSGMVGRVPQLEIFWHPVVGIASEMQNPSAATLLVARRVFSLGGKITTLNGFPELNPFESDLIVLATSQRNGREPDIAEEFDNTVHAMETLLPGKLGEMTSPLIAEHVRAIFASPG